MTLQAVLYQDGLMKGLTAGRTQHFLLQDRSKILKKIVIMTSKTRAYGRGILRFTCWEPCRLPGQVHNLIDLKQVETGRKNCAENVNHVNTTKTDTSQTSAGIAG